MGRFSRGPGVPDQVRAAVTGRVLAAAEAQDGTWLVGTRDALHLVGTSRHVLPWERVHRADWDLEASTLRVEEVSDFGAPVTSWSFALSEPGGLLPLVRERVTASVVVQQKVELRGRRGVTVIGRRSPTGRGNVAWAYEFDPGIDPEDPAVMQVAEAALRDVQASLGLG